MIAGGGFASGARRAVDEARARGSVATREERVAAGVKGARESVQKELLRILNQVTTKRRGELESDARNVRGDLSTSGLDKFTIIRITNSIEFWQERLKQSADVTADSIKNTQDASLALDELKAAANNAALEFRTFQDNLPTGQGMFSVAPFDPSTVASQAGVSDIANLISGTGTDTSNIEGAIKLQETMAAFSNTADTLSTALNNFPREVQHTIGGQVEIILNGAEVLSRMMPAIQELITARISEGINKFTKENFPELGQQDQ